MEDRTRAPETYLDPQMKAFIAEGAALAKGLPDTFSAPIDVARAAIETAQRPVAVGGPVMHRTEDRWIDIGGRRMLVRLHLPSDRPNRPVIVFFHGGGWTWNSIDTHDRVAREYAARTGFAVAASDYAMAPEYRFPIPMEECVRVVRWFAEHGADWGLDGTRIAVAGDSAGANLALAVCMVLRGSAHSPKAALLNYGSYEPSYDRDAHRWLGESTLSPQTWKLKWFWQNYLGQPDTDDWRAAPMRGSLANLPPLRLQVGQLDILCDENRDLAEKVRGEGTEAECIVYPGVTHGFLRAAGRVDMADKALADGAEWLSAILSPS